MWWYHVEWRLHKGHEYGITSFSLCSISQPSRKQRLKARLLQVRKRGTEVKLSLLTASGKGRTRLRK